MASIEGKIVWITGGSSGIGEALTYELNNRGCKLIISARNIIELERVKNNCSNPEAVKIIDLDLQNFNGLIAKTAEAIAFFGHIDILVNNAGISQRSYIINTDFDVYRKLMEINYLGTVALSKAILPHFVERQKGQFVIVSSVMGKFGAPPRSGYCGAKHALHGFFDTLRMEHEKDSIDVTLICPGYVQTPIAKNALTADGSPLGNDDTNNQNGLDVTQFVKKMVRAIEKKKFEAYMGKKEVLGVYLKRFFPRLLHRVVVRKTVKS